MLQAKLKNFSYIIEHCRIIETNFTIIWRTYIWHPYAHVHIFFWYQQMLNSRSKVQVLEDLDAFKHFIIIHNNTIKQNFLGKWSEMSYLNSVSSTFNLKQNGTHIHKPFIYSFYFFTAVRISNVRGITNCRNRSSDIIRAILVTKVQQILYSFLTVLEVSIIHFSFPGIYNRNKNKQKQCLSFKIYNFHTILMASHTPTSL